MKNSIKTHIASPYTSVHSHRYEPHSTVCGRYKADEAMADRAGDATCKVCLKNAWPKQLADKSPSPAAPIKAGAALEVHEEVLTGETRCGLASRDVVVANKKADLSPAVTCAACIEGKKREAIRIAEAEGAAEYREAYEQADPKTRRQMDIVDAIDREELDECTGCGLTDADGVNVDETGLCNECRQGQEERLAAIEHEEPGQFNVFVVDSKLVRSYDKPFTCVPTERAPEPFIQPESYGCELGPIVGPEAVCQHCLVAVADHWRIPMPAIENLHMGFADGGLLCGAPSAYTNRTWNPDAVTCAPCRDELARRARRAAEAAEAQDAEEDMPFGSDAAALVEQRAERRREDAAKLEQGVRDSYARVGYPEGEQQAPVAAHDEHACGVCFGEVTDGGAGHAAACPYFEMPLGGAALQAERERREAALVTLRGALKVEEERVAVARQAREDRADADDLAARIADAVEALADARVLARRGNRDSINDKLTAFINELDELLDDVRIEAEAQQPSVEFKFTAAAYLRSHGKAPREGSSTIGQWAFRAVNNDRAYDEDATGPIFFTAPMTYAQALAYVRSTQKPGLYAVLP